MTIERKNALISVWHKEGIVGFAQSLIDLGWNLYASGGTKREIEASGIHIHDVAELVGGGAILGHRVVTLSREVGAALLAKDTSADLDELIRLVIPWIDLVCVDLYPLEEEIKREGATTESILEMTDIGGPTMISEGAKGRRIVIADPVDRQKVLDWFRDGRPNEENFRNELGAKADMVVANYRLLTARYHSQGLYDGLLGTRVRECSYGENAWQTPAGLYSTSSTDPLALDKFEVVAGEPSYNNWLDIDRLLQTMTHIAAAFSSEVPYIALAVKHGNTCGAAVGNDPTDVLQRMVIGDRRAIFGGVVMTNFPLTESLALVLRRYQTDGSPRLLDMVAAPTIEEAAVKVLSRREERCKMVVNPDLARLTIDTSPRSRQVRGGWLAQPNYTFVMDKALVEKFGEMTSQQEENLLLAWAIGSTSNSNTITLVKAKTLIGNGVGQQDRVSCAELAIKRARDAEHFTEGAVAYSDSFFPFPDGAEVLANAGVTAILTSSGSVNDKETIRVCQEKGVGLMMVPDRIGRGFFGH